MKSLPVKLLIVGSLLSNFFLVGCTSAADPRLQLWEKVGAQPLQVRPLQYDLQIEIDPDTHRIDGSAAIRMQTPRQRPARGQFGIGLRVNDGLQIEQVTGKSVINLYGPVLKDQRRHYIVTVDRPTPVIELRCRYSGQLAEDIAAGEIRGQIHNFTVQAHIGPQGVFLAEEADWYPHVYTDRRELPPLVAYRLRAAKRDHLQLAASCDRGPDDNQFQQWISRRNLPGLTVAGGPLQRDSRAVGQVTIETLLHPEQARFSNGLLDAMQHYLEIYEPLLGSYPYDHFTVVENFFSSGFAYPTFTLMGSAVIQMGERGLQPGYLDHEMVHNWWGNGVQVDPRDGNWCEALTSYCANYYRYIAENDLEGARRHRRDIVNRLAQISTTHDKPLGDFDRPGGPSRLIGYQKGAMVFHMLSRQIGEENFWAALRRLGDRCMGRYTSWDDLQQVFEEAGGQNLDLFFEQWVRGRGLPKVAIQSARYDSSENILQVVITRDGPFLELTVPLRVLYTSGPEAEFEDFPLPMEEPMRTFQVLLNRPPVAVQLDPEYHLLRHLPYQQIMPTLSSIGRGALTIILPDEALEEGYAKLVEQVVHEGTRQLTADRLPPADWQDSHLLIVGSVVNRSEVQTLLKEAGLNITWQERGFTINGQDHNGVAEALLVTFHHPRKSGAMISIYFGNSPEALSNADLLGFYPNSLLVFENGRPTCREDFEISPVIEVHRP